MFPCTAPQHVGSDGAKESKSAENRSIDSEKKASCGEAHPTQVGCDVGCQDSGNPKAGNE